MPFNRPTLPALIERAESAIDTRLTGADARLRRSNLNVLARVNAAGDHHLHGHLDIIAKQVIVDSADKDVLERHARIWVPPGRLPAAPAVGSATAVGTTGAVVPAGTVYVRNDGQRYATTAEVEVVDGVATLPLEAEEAGQDGNADAGITLSAASPLPGVNAKVTVTEDALTGGADIEKDDNLLARILDRIQEPPMGGSKADYVKWAKEVPGVTRAWCSPREMGDGTVTVRFVRDGDASPIPDAAEVDAVYAHIDEQRPAGGQLFVVAPIEQPVVFQIQLIPNTAAAKAAVEASLRDLFLREAEPERGAGEGTLLISHMREAVSLATGEKDSTIVSPAGNVTRTLGEMSTFGDIEWLP
jgi:uncharacterized phage protein gp47/JayE